METQNYSEDRTDPKGWQDALGSSDRPSLDDLTQNETVGQDSKNRWKGIGLLCIFHAINILVTSLWWDALMGVSLVGITQLVYVIPTVLLFTIIKKDGWIEGLAIGSAVTILLSPAITGAIILYMAHRSGL